LLALLRFGVPKNSEERPKEKYAISHGGVRDKE
jgi:hypothetical protein